ncbi:RNA-binding protein, putative [Hepatocystis sp. ex Piliocolobus tephrosceles]|nr:RNA-binding protein, putative [Hepatocystis sp. ex Piliocolobus tephrosceles]
MSNILNHFRVLKVVTEDNPLVTFNLFVASTKDNTNNDGSCSEILCVAVLDNIINGEHLRKFMTNFGDVVFFNITENENLSINLKIFAYCLYIKFKEQAAIDVILSYSVKINEYFKNNIQVPYFIKIEKNNYSTYIKDYYNQNYNLYNGRKIIVNDIINSNKVNKKKKIVNTVDSDGFTVVQRSLNKPEIVNSVFSQTDDKLSYLKKKEKKKTYGNFYLFKKKDSHKLNFIYTKEIVKKKRKEVNQKKKIIK